IIDDSSEDELLYNNENNITRGDSVNVYNTLSEQEKKEVQNFLHEEIEDQKKINIREDSPIPQPERSTINTLPLDGSNSNSSIPTPIVPPTLHNNNTMDSPSKTQSKNNICTTNRELK